MVRHANHFLLLESEEKTIVSERTLIIIDEFPFIAEENPTIKSILQHVIDHLWKNNMNIFLILCDDILNPTTS